MRTRSGDWRWILSRGRVLRDADGLALAQLIAQRHGGRIWAESAPGHGSVFRFTLGDAAPGS